jgi:hypothetical protein
MKMRAKKALSRLLGWLGCYCLAGCALLTPGDEKSEALRRSSEQANRVPVVPAVPAPSASDASVSKPSTGASASTAQLTAGLRSRNSESNLEISGALEGTEASRQPQAAPGMRQGRWTGDRITWEQARDRLRKQGVTWMQLELHENLWRLNCSIPSQQDSGKVRFFEAEANSELEAMRAVLEKIENSRL